MIVDIRNAIAHLRAGGVDSEDTLLIQLYLDAATRRVEGWINRRLYPAGHLPLPAPVGAIEADAAIRHAILILLTQSYDERSGVSEAPDLGMPATVQALLAPYRRFGAL